MGGGEAVVCANKLDNIKEELADVWIIVFDWPTLAGVEWDKTVSEKVKRNEEK